MSVLKQIPNFTNYLISECGEIYSTKPLRNFAKKTDVPHKLKPAIDKDGYLKIKIINDNNEYKDKRVHVLVAETYLENNNNHPIVRHLDGSKDNNKVSNLAWGTYKQNSNDSKNHKTWVHGEKVNTNKLKENQVIDIIKSNDTVKNLSYIFGVTIGTIYHIKRKHTWKHLST